LRFGTEALDLADCLPKLQVHPANGFVVDGISDTLPSSCLSDWWIRD